MVREVILCALCEREIKPTESIVFVEGETPVHESCWDIEQQLEPLFCEDRTADPTSQRIAERLIAEVFGFKP